MSADETRFPTRLLLAALIGAAALGLSGCGLRGNLDRPEPLWGDPQEDVQEDLERDDDDEDEEDDDFFDNDY